MFDIVAKREKLFGMGEEHDEECVNWIMVNCDYGWILKNMELIDENYIRVILVKYTNNIKQKEDE